MEQQQRQHREELISKQREINQLSKENRMKAKKLLDLERADQKRSMVLKQRLEELSLSKKKLKEIQDQQQKRKQNKERYTKEEKQNKEWIEKQLKKQVDYDLIINKLQRDIEKKDQLVETMKQLLEQKEKQLKEKNQLMPSSVTDENDEKELNDIISDLNIQIDQSIQAINSVNPELYEHDSENDTIRKLKSSTIEEAHMLLCILYKKIVDLQHDFKDTQDIVFF